MLVGLVFGTSAVQTFLDSITASLKEKQDKDKLDKDKQEKQDKDKPEDKDNQDKDKKDKDKQDKDKQDKDKQDKDKKDKDKKDKDKSDKDKKDKDNKNKDKKDKDKKDKDKKDKDKKDKDKNEQDKDNEDKDKPQSVLFAEHLRVHKHVSALHIVAAPPGHMVASDDWTLLTKLVNDHKPDFVVLDVGGEDLAEDVDELLLAGGVVEAALRLVRDGSTQCVLLCTALRRTAQTGRHSYQEYNYRVNQYNSIISDWCEVEAGLVFHTHRGFWQGSVATWSLDGVHVNTDAGTARYATSLRRATFAAMSNIL